MTKKSFGPKKTDNLEKIDFQVLPHKSADSLNNLLHNEAIMSSFASPIEHNKLDILYDEDNNGLHIMRAHNKFMEYLRSRANNPF
jgi:hypothetical protein